MPGEAREKLADTAAAANTLGLRLGGDGIARGAEQDVAAAIIIGGFRNIRESGAMGAGGGAFGPVGGELVSGAVAEISAADGEAVWAAARPLAAIPPSQALPELPAAMTVLMPSAAASSSSPCQAARKPVPRVDSQDEAPTAMISASADCTTACKDAKMPG